MSESEAGMEAAKAISHARSVVVACHKNPEGDAIGSALAMLLALEHLGKQALAVNQDPMPGNIAFLPAGGKLLRDIPADFEFDLAIVVDCGDLSRVGDEVEARIKKAGCPIINIDHHPTNTKFGSINIVKENASATAEIILEFLKAMKVPVSQDIATNLYTGLVADTGSFKYVNTTPRVLAAAGELIEAGADPGFISQQYFDVQPLNNVRLLAMALGTLEVGLMGRFASVEITEEMFSATSTGPDAVEGFVEYARNVKGVLIAALLREQSGGGVKISLRSNRGVDVASIALSLGGGGHKVAAGCSIDDTDLAGAKKIILEKAGNLLKESGV